METIKVIKIGGNIIDDEFTLDRFLASYAQIEGKKILVHGGGKLASKLAEQMKIPVQMVEGRRITDAATLELITMMYAGKISKNIVAKLQGYGCNAVGFSGADGNTIVAQKRPVHTVDYGFVGDVTRVNTQLLKLLLDQNISLCFCAITHDENGQLLNTNADTIASEIAIALSKDFEVELYYSFEKNGVLTNIDDPNSVLEYIDITTYLQLKEDQVIFQGMIPKLDNCFHALNNGVHQIHLGSPEMIFNPQVKHTTLSI